MSWRDFYKSGFSSPYGDCRPVGSDPCGRRHRGQDLSHSRTSGTIAVPALFSGRVVRKYRPNDGTGFGHGIVVRSTLGDGGEWDFYYAHGPWASSQNVGDLVSQGQIILHEGLSGFTSGPCVHIEQQSVRTGNFTNPREEIDRVANGQGDYVSQPKPAPVPQPSGGSGAVAGVHGPNPFGIPFTGGLQKIAKKYGYSGPLDQNWISSDPVKAAESGSMKGFAQFLRSNYGYSGNNVLGPVMWSYIAKWLRATKRYSGNDEPGPVMRAALLQADTENWAAL